MPRARVAPTLEALEAKRRRRLLVGRKPELALVRRALAGRGARVIYLHGPGGIGKTTLLQAFAAEARRRGIAVTSLDGRELDASLIAVLAALDEAGLTMADDPVAAPRMVLLDGYEHLRALDGQLCYELLRRTRGATILVLAGRAAPGAEWRTLSLWGHEVVPIALRNLEPAEATTYLQRRAIRGSAAATIVAFSHGHPLALALTADAWRSTPDLPFTPAAAPTVITTLYDYFVRSVAEPVRRAALEVAAVLRITSEEMLGVMLGPDAATTFGWLRELSFMSVGGHGVLPHDLARDVILAELRWRNPERLAALVLRAQRHYAALLRVRTGAEHARSFADFAFVLGHNPRLRGMMSHADAELTGGPLRSGEEPMLHAMVARHEGTTSLQHLRHWLAAQPTAFHLVRSSSGDVLAFLASLRLDLTTAAQRAADPVVLAAWDHALRVLGGPPRGPLAYARFAMARDTYQDLSPALAKCWQLDAAMFFLPELTLAFVRFREGRRWESLVAFVGARFVTELQHETDGHMYEVTLQDQRGVTGADWLASMNERTAVGDWREPPPVHPEQPSLTALSREDFAARVRAGLRSVHDPIALVDNALIHSEVVRSRVAPRASARERAVGLQAVLGTELEALRGTARGDGWYRVLAATYLDRAVKHESAARDLRMSYSTFRRRLNAATRHVVEVLWQRELALTHGR